MLYFFIPENGYGYSCNHVTFFSESDLSAMQRHYDCSAEMTRLQCGDDTTTVRRWSNLNGVV